MADTFGRSVLKVVLAQYSQAIGFDSSHTIPLTVLSDVLEQFLCQLGRSVHDIMEECSHTYPSLRDVFRSFDHNHISIFGLNDYLQQMDDITLLDEMYQFPMHKNSNFQFPNLGYSHELKHVFSHSPSILHATEIEGTKPCKEHDKRQQSRSPLFTIAGKQDLSDDEVGSYTSDISVESARCLTKPEDIPIVSGIAASSFASVSSQSWDGFQNTNRIPTSQMRMHVDQQLLTSPGSTDRNQEPIWVQQHAAKLEKETSKISQTAVLIGLNDKKKKTDSPNSHSKITSHSHSLWDSPIFSRKMVTSPVTADGFSKDASKKTTIIKKLENTDDLTKTCAKLNEHKISISSRIEEVDRLLKDPIVKKTPLQGTKMLKLPYRQETTEINKTCPKNICADGESTNTKHPVPSFASPKSIDEAISSVVSRVSKEVEEAELMKFSHLIEDSSSSDEEEAVFYKTEQMLQLEKRGLYKHHEDESPNRPPLTPSPALSTNSLIIDQEINIKNKPPERIQVKEDPLSIYTSDDTECEEETKWNLCSQQISISNDHPPSSLTEICEKNETKSKSSRKTKKRLKNKIGVSHKEKFYDQKSKVQKLILKTYSGDAKILKVAKTKDVVFHERDKMPVPKLSASIAVPTLPKEKKKEKKDKKKKKQKNRDNKITKSKDETPIPKLTFKVNPSAQHVSIIQPSKTKRQTLDVDVAVPAKKMDIKMAPERKVVTKTISVASAGVGVVIDAQGNQVWICPACNKPDDGSPMIGCDKCDGWYHWPCVGISKEPPESEQWFCPLCVKHKQTGKKKYGRTKLKSK